jgi:signal transduction histidine kinase
LCEVAGTRYALFAEVVSKDRLQVVALTRDGRTRELGELELTGSIHQEVLRLGTHHCASDARRRFPEDPLLAELSVQGFMGVSVGLAHGAPFGVLSTFHDSPLRALPEPTTLLETFALRAAAEVKHVQLERALERQAQLVEASQRAHAQTLAEVTDLSERQGLERRLQSVQKLESLARLAGGVAHDFNNLLVGILGNVGYALSELPESSPLYGALGDAQHAALRAADLTKQMLAYSGKGRFLLERLNLNTLLEEMTPLLGSGLSKKASLTFELAAELPEVEADPAQMRQLILNLLTNAGDALGEQKGVISITTGVMHAERDYLSTTYLDEGLPAGEYVFLQVSDTGPGIEPGAVAKIFDPFFTTKFTGRGLGLAAVLGILRGHRGAIRVDSQRGQGSTFRVLFPVAVEVELEHGPSAPPDSGVFMGQGLVLVADDEETVRNVATRVLAKCGFRVITARDGAEAVKVYAEHAQQIVLVLLDMTMPGLGGDDVFRELQRIRPDVRVVLTSGYSENDVTSAFVGRGLAGFLQKPWVPGELVRTLRRAFGT